MEIEFIYGWINRQAPAKLNSTTAKIADEVNSCFKKAPLGKFPQRTKK